MTTSSAHATPGAAGPHCPICGSADHRILRNRLRYGVIRDVADCQGCGFVYLWPRLGQKETVEYYTGGDYRGIQRESLGLQTHDAEGTFHSRMGQAVHRFKIVKPYLSRDKTLLEIGCGSGSFLSLVQPLVKQCTAMELDAPFAEYVRQRFHVEVMEKAIEDLPTGFGPFDLLTMWFVLEHLHDPLNDLVRMRDLVSERGLLFMLLPNLQDPLVTIYRSQPYADFFYQLPHLNYFSPRVMADTLHRSGWQGEIKPVQIYGLANHLRWIFKGKPQAKQSKGTVDLWNVPDQAYRFLLGLTGHTDSLLVIARKR